MPLVLALILVFSVITAVPTAHSAEIASKTVTQLDLAKKMIDTFGWSEGLPEKPAAKDYLAILEGNRTFRFEAEDIYDRQSDTVSVKDIPRFGAFTGSGWILGISTPTAVHFRALLPISGTYTLKASAMGGEQLWSIAGRAFKTSFGGTLNERKIGQVFIPTGYIDFNALIPPSGGIDYIIFSAPAHAAIAPALGWNFNAPLTTAALAETVSSLRGNEQLLPDDVAFIRKTVDAAASPLPAGAVLTDVQVYGKPVASKWVRATQVPASLAIPVTVDRSGVYSLRIRCLGNEISAGFGSRKVTLPAKPFLDWVDLGVFRLQQGTHTLEVQLPPAGGADVIQIGRKLSTPADYLAINKISSKEDAVVSPEELDAVMKSLQKQFSERR